MRITFVIGLSCLIGLTLISGGSALINIGAMVLFTSAILSAAAYLVIHATRRSSVKFDPSLYYQAARRSK
jgi:hypothetical protein